MEYQESEIHSLFEAALDLQVSFEQQAQLKPDWKSDPDLFPKIAGFLNSFEQMPVGALSEDEQQALTRYLLALNDGLSKPGATSPSALSNIIDKGIAEIISRGEARIRNHLPQLDALKGAEARIAAIQEAVEALAQQVLEVRGTAATELEKLKRTYSIEDAARKKNEEIAFEQFELNRNAELQRATRDAEALSDMHKQATRLIAAMGEKGTTTNYRIIADKESTAANFYRGVTLAIFGLGIVIATTSLWLHFRSPETLDSIAIKLLFAIVITTPAWYTAKESARHRSTADRARRTELELASLGPYIEMLPTDERTKIRAALTTRYFGTDSKDHDVSPPVDINTLLQRVTDMLKAAKDR